MNTDLKKLLGAAGMSLILLGFFSQIALTARAQNNNQTPALPSNYQQILGNGIRNPIDTNSTPALLLKLMRNVLLIIAGVTVAMVLNAGWIILTSQGNETRLKSGKQALLWSILGFVVVLLAFSIIGIIQNILQPS